MFFGCQLTNNRFLQYHSDWVEAFGGWFLARQIALYVDYQLCRSCVRCLAAEVCRVRAIIKPEADDSPYLELQRCLDCRLCLPACPFHAIARVNPLAY
jgi:Fe-S-cluster-containing hydrogenase component 2